LEYFVNGRTLGTAFTTILPPVRAAVSLVNNQRLRLRFPPRETISQAPSPPMVAPVINEFVGFDDIGLV
jgi:hypothetical protein